MDDEDAKVASSRRTNTSTLSEPHEMIIWLVTERPASHEFLKRTVELYAECRVLGPTSDLAKAARILPDGLIVDQVTNTSRTRSMVGRLPVRQGKPIPAIYLTPRFGTDDAVAGTGRIYYSVETSPTILIKALMAKIRPEANLSDVALSRSMALSDQVLSTMWDQAGTGRLDRELIESGIDPVVDAIREGGLSGWLDLVWQHDDATYQHCLLVSGLTANFARQLNFSESDAKRLTRAALVHDVGKAKIPLEILNKAGPLDADETRVMRRHPEIGHDILVRSGSYEPLVLAITRHHHELLDGSGYPDGLSAATIADPIRLLTVCDIYAALIERRSYKAPMTHLEAIETLRTMSGKIEDGFVDAFARAVDAGSQPCDDTSSIEDRAS